MARVELIHGMTDEQLDTNKEYARRMVENNPDMKSYMLRAELIELERQFRAKLEEYRAAVRAEYTGPTSPGG